MEQVTVPLIAEDVAETGARDPADRFERWDARTGQILESLEAMAAEQASLRVLLESREGDHVDH